MIFVGFGMGLACGVFLVVAALIVNAPQSAKDAREELWTKLAEMEDGK